MKGLKLTLIALFGLAVTSFAQQKASGKATISVPGMNCEDCKTRIEAFLTRQYGVTTVNANFRRKNVTVTWLTDRTDIEQVKTHIANCGYDADDVTADETAYKRLPKACQKPVVPAPPPPPVPAPKVVPAVAPPAPVATPAKPSVITAPAAKPANAIPPARPRKKAPTAVKQ